MHQTSTSKKVFIGISQNFHDPSIALINDQGEIIFAQATERFLQNKRALSSAADNFFYAEAIINQFEIKDYEISSNWKQFENIFKYWIIATAVSIFKNKANLSKTFLRVFTKNTDEVACLINFHLASHFGTRAMTGAAFKYLLNIKNKLPYKSISHFDHHLCHAYHAFFTSPVEQAIILIIDGNGDNAKSMTIYEANRQSIKQLHRNTSRASLGDYYGALTVLCGFGPLGEEAWKVMGMAAYGKINEELLNDLREWIVIKNISIKHKNANKFYEIREKITTSFYKNLNKFDLAFTGQFFYEELVIQLINNTYKKFPHKNLIMSGGCSLNSSCNGKIHTHTNYKHVYIPSAPADDGTAIGSALINFKKHFPDRIIPYSQTNPYLGFEINSSDIEHIKLYSGYHIEKMSYENIYQTIAEEIKNGKLIGWVQGKAEFGPRALGNRSILAHPGISSMKDIINSKVKFREDFRPFAPAILEEKATEYFENYHPTPYMERVLKIKKDKRQTICAVNHIDNTGRLQTVSKNSNYHFYNLINAFYRETGIPVLLNTSFNVMGKPIVNSVNDMITVFATSGLDIMVINDHVVRKTVKN